MGERVVSKKCIAVGCVYLLFVGMAGLLVWLYFDTFSVYGWTKMLLASGYLLVAVLMGALESKLGRWLLLGFFCAWWGDFFLIGRGYGFFLAGLIAFLLGHVFYCIAYTTHGARLNVVPALFAALCFPGAALAWILWPGIPVGLRAPVMMYITVITLMVSLSLACVGRPGGRLLVLGAFCFCLSDIGVSMGAFGNAEWKPLAKLVVLYFPGQYILAVAILAARRAMTAGQT
jgi:uncharacterized membrane protein YhhN